MDLELRDKVAIVGGASKGLGRACAEVLAQEGAQVAIWSRSKDDLEKAASEIRAATGREVLVFAGDLDRPETIRDLVAATVARFGRLDVLVNNSGGPPLAQAQSATEEQWETAVQRSLFFFGRMCREALPHLKRQRAGRIINILASTVYQPIPNLVLSGVTRMGVVAFAKTLADEVGRDGVLVNNVCPGSIMSERILSTATPPATHLASLPHCASMARATPPGPALVWGEKGTAAPEGRGPDPAPTLGSPQVLEGFDPSGASRPRPARRPIPLRHLLTHTAGFGYDMWD